MFYNDKLIITPNAVNRWRFFTQHRRKIYAVTERQIKKYQRILNLKLIICWKKRL